MNRESIDRPRLATLIFAAAALLLCGSMQAQSQAPFEQSQPQDQTLTFHAGTSLVLLDVFTLDPKTGMPLNKLKREDFQVLDNGSPVSLVAFDSGAHFDTKPVALWLVPLCNMRDWGDLGSGLFAGKSALFRPALDHLDKHDTVGVAHWCDNGEAEIDLPPGRDPEAAIAALEKALRKRDFNHPVCTSQLDKSPCLKGEQALQRTLRLILQNAYQTKPQPVPVIVFLHSDHTGMPLKQVNELVDDVLETSGIVFGIKDSSLPEWPTQWYNTKEKGSILHYISDETGGQYFRAPEKLYAATLEDILLLLHFRYELGFKPSVIDGKRHTLKVELVGDAKADHKSARLRYRPEYIPVPD